MNLRLFRSITEPIREDLTWEERWKGPDNGLITCWENGRNISLRDLELAERARKGELPVMAWKGGVEEETKIKVKFGTLNYLAQWQGLRGDDLDIDLSEEIAIVCSRTKIKVIFTGDATKYANA